MKLRQETRNSSIICEEMSITMFVYFFDDSNKDFMLVVEI